MNVLDLFSGIGGFSLGLERAGMRTVAFCEIEPYCRAVLARHWPNVPCYDDVRTLTADRLRADGISVDLICGGFPCQDISRAGYGRGLAGERSGLWFEYARLIGELRPRFVLVENVAALLDRGMDAICGTLADLRYDAEWSTVSACSVGAPHVRQRVFIVAYPDSEHGRPRVRDTAARSYRPLQEIDGFAGSRARWRARLANPSALYGGADGIPNGMDRNHAIGNAVLPAVAELYGRAIMSAGDYADYDLDDYDPGDECGRWSNGKLTLHCALAGTEFCDFECPHRTRRTVDGCESGTASPNAGSLPNTPAESVQE